MFISHCYLFLFYPIIVYHKFDNVVCPPPENLSGVTTTFGKLGKWVLRKIGMAGKEAEEPATPVSFELLSQPNEMNELCLHVYLDKYKNYLLEGHCGDSPNLVAMVDQMYHIYQSLHIQLTVREKSYTANRNFVQDFYHVRETLILVLCNLDKFTFGSENEELVIFSFGSGEFFQSDSGCGCGIFHV